MVDVVKRKAAHHWEIKAQNGDYFEINKDCEYTTSLERNDGTVMVFSNYWVSVPIENFYPLSETIKKDKGEKPQFRKDQLCVNCGQYLGGGIQCCNNPKAEEGSHEC